MKRRLFTAIEPDERFAQAVQKLHSSLPGANWETEPHITLTHFGDVEAESLPELTAALEAVMFSTFVLELSGTGFFGEEDAPAVAWLAFKQSSELERLHAEVSVIRQRFASSPERHSFNPHLTLARTNRCEPAAVHTYLRSARESTLPAQFDVARFELFESTNETYSKVATVRAQR